LIEKGGKNMSTRSISFSSDDVFNLLKAAYESGKIGIADPDAPPKPDDYKRVPGERFLSTVNDKASAVDLDMIDQLLVLGTPLIGTLGTPFFSMVLGQLLAGPQD